MANFDAIEKSLNEALLVVFGEYDAVFTPASGPTITGRVWLEEEDLQQIDGYESITTVQISTLEYVLSEFNDIEADVGETFTVNGKVWTVRRRMERGRKTVKFEVSP